jgi:hypothetical protein
MSQIARNLTDSENGILTGKRYLIHDRDPLFTAEFMNMIADVGVASVKLPPRSPNLNAYAERFVRSIKESCLERMILFGEDSLRTAIQNFVAHYHSERNHQGLANQLISPEEGHLGSAGEVQRRQRFRRHAELLLPKRCLSHEVLGSCLLIVTAASSAASAEREPRTHESRGTTDAPGRFEMNILRSWTRPTCDGVGVFRHLRQSAWQGKSGIFGPYAMGLISSRRSR